MTTARRIVLTLLPPALALGLLWLGRAARPQTPAPVGRPPAAGIPAPASRGLPGAVSAGPLLAEPPPLAPRPSPIAPLPFLTDHPALRLAADPAETLPARFAALDRLLAAALEPAVLAETIAFLGSPVPAEVNAATRERALRNDLLNRLRDHPAHAGALVAALATQAADKTQDSGLRDYALQHLAVWVPALDDAGRAQAIPALQAALGERAATYAGTALIGLADLEKRGFLPEPFDAAAEARRLALQERTSILSRLTALALATELGVVDDDLAALARRWAEPASPVPEGARRAARAFLKLQPPSS